MQKRCWASESHLVGNAAFLLTPRYYAQKYVNAARIAMNHTASVEIR